MATEVITSLATKLYEVVKLVKGNKEQCKEIGSRAQRLVPLVKRIGRSDAGEKASFLCFLDNPSHHFRMTHWPCA